MTNSTTLMNNFGTRGTNLFPMRLRKYRSRHFSQILADLRSLETACIVRSGRNCNLLKSFADFEEMRVSG